MVTRFGMTEDLGEVTYETARSTFLDRDSFAALSEREFSEETAREIDCTVRDPIKRALDKAKAILETYRTQLEQGAALLLEMESLTRKEMPRLEPPPEG